MNVATDIRSELQAVIDKSLPSLEAQRLRSYIDEAERAKEEHVRARQEYERVKGTLVDEEKAKVVLRAQLADAQKEIAAFRERENNFKASERAVLDANHRAVVAEESRKAAMDVVALFTKNPEIRREHWTSTSKNTPIIPPGQSYATGTAMESGSSTAGVTERSE